MVQYNEIEKCYSPTFIPLPNIGDREMWIENNIDYGRCSAFSKFFTTYEEVVENIDNESDENKEIFRNRFYNLLLDIKKGHKIYWRKRRMSFLNELIDLEKELIVSLVEKCEIDLFIPDIQMVFIGHDDFGFIVLSETSNPFLKDLELLIANNQLYLLKLSEIVTALKSQQSKKEGNSNLRRKRLKHYTDVFCDMFTGWRLSNEDIETLQNFGNGKLLLDFLTKKIYFNDNEANVNLYILSEISAWFEKNLQKENIDFQQIRKAYLIVNLNLVNCATKPKSRTKKIIQVNVDMTAIIKTDIKEYRTDKQTKNEYHYVQR